MSKIDLIEKSRSFEKMKEIHGLIHRTDNRCFEDGSFIREIGEFIKLWESEFMYKIMWIQLMKLFPAPWPTLAESLNNWYKNEYKSPLLTPYGEEGKYLG